MKALAYDAFGSADVLHFADLPTPKPAPGEVLVAMRATSLNLIDARVRSGMMGPLVRKRFPKIPCADIAGTVAALGVGVDGLRIGDAVFGAVNPFAGGALAEYAAVPARQLAIKPPDLSFEQAACLPIAGLAALQALRDLGRVSAGSEVLIHGASGPVGLFAVQLAKHFGGRVTAVAGTPGIAAVRAAGADEAVDYRLQGGLDFPRAFDVIVNASGALPFAKAKRFLKRDGRLIEPSPTIPLFIGSKLANLVRTRQHLALAVAPKRDDLETIASLAVQGRVATTIAWHFAFSEAKVALEALDRGGTVGKLVVGIA
jgi:NADPH:quinone reductase-like Zn-dependent oxidoreductase